MTSLVDNEDFKKFLAGGSYQPIPTTDFYDPRAVRAKGCVERWGAICKILPMDKPQRILDIGCNLGYFCMMSVEAGHIADGFDADEEVIFWGNKVIEEYNIPNIKLWASSLDILQNLREIPDDSYDYVFYLSVHHHICAGLGIEEANEVFKEISRIAPNMIFDMGQSNEVDNGWLTWLKKIPQFVNHFIDIPNWVIENSEFEYAANIGGSISHEIDRKVFLFIKNVPTDVDYSKKIISMRDLAGNNNKIKGYFVKGYVWKEPGGSGKVHVSSTGFPIMDLTSNTSTRYYIVTDLSGSRFFVKEYLYCWLSPNKIYHQARITYEQGKALQRISGVQDKVIAPIGIEGNMVIYPFCPWPALHTLPDDEIKHNFFYELLEVAGRIYQEIGVFDINPNNILYDNKTGEFKLIDFELAGSNFTFGIFTARLGALYERFNKIFKGSGENK